VKFSVLGSGSKENCTLVEAGSTRLLIDNGFSGKEIVNRLSA
jgi:phosphoribosyl 1,2-cyclic phosphodiesterase